MNDLNELLAEAIKYKYKRNQRISEIPWDLIRYLAIDNGHKALAYPHHAKGFLKSC